MKPRDTGNVVNPMDALRKSLSTPASAVPRNQQKAGSRTPQPASRTVDLGGKLGTRAFGEAVTQRFGTLVK